MYSIRKVTEDLFWVGANDHRTALFENIHPIPEGVSYNAYLLKDEKNVLFDTVDWSQCRQLLENLQYLLKDEPLDYLVIHHVEPDHGAGIQEILNQYPDITIVSSAMGFRFMNQYGVKVNPNHIITVKEGSTISFGKHELQFIAAPMVHWPEVLLSFDRHNGVLFSADAFGTFKALDGKLFADEVDFDRDWIDEARRYYTNIVGKFGKNVQDVLKKAQTIHDSIRYICPLHGPVWRENIDYFLGKYDLWSQYLPVKKGVLIVYGSMYGNTEAACQSLATDLCENGISNLEVFDVSNTHVSTLIAKAFQYSHIVLASVTYNADMYPPIHNLLADMKALNVQNRTFALIENGTWSSQAGNKMRHFIENELNNCTILDTHLIVSASLQNDQAENLNQLSKALIESLH